MQHVQNLFKLIRMFTVAVSTKVQIRLRITGHQLPVKWSVGNLCEKKSLCNNTTNALFKFITSWHHVPVCSIIQENEYHKFATCLPTFYNFIQHKMTDNHPDRGLYFFLSETLTAYNIIWEILFFCRAKLIDQSKNVMKANSLPKKVMTTWRPEVQHTEQQHCWVMIHFWNVKIVLPSPNNLKIEATSK